MARTKRKIHIEINKAWCKRCGICIAFCPDKVLEDDDGLPRIIDIALCSGCLTCELLCPDFAIEVHVEKEAASGHGG